MKKLKIWYYKSKLKRMYLDYMQNDSYDCGSSLRDYISPSKERMNLVIDKLQSLGESINKFEVNQ